MSRICFSLMSFLLSFSSFGARVPKAVPDSIRSQYQYLYNLPVQTHADGSRTFHNGRLFLRHGLYILSLKGDRFEMAFQHGRLLKEVIPQGALIPAAEMLEKSARNSLPSIPFVTDTIIKFIYNRYPRAIIKSSLSLSGDKAESAFLDGYGLADGADISLETLFDAATGPESLQVLLGERYGKKGSLAAPTSSCSAFVAWGNSTQSGDMIIARNTDYPLNGNFDKFPTVIYFEPVDGQKYMAVTSAGLHNAGVVGFNESGLYLGVHTVPSIDVSTKGVPIFMIAQEVLREAKSFDQALAMFKQKPPAAGWAYMIVSTKEQKAATLELSNHGYALLPSEGTYHVQTNHYRTPQMVPNYLHVNFSIDEDTYARRQRIDDLIQEKRPLQLASAFEILGDKTDPFSKEVRGVGNVVAVHTTMTSVVLEPTRDRLFVANGTAPVSLSSYVELPLLATFNRDTFDQTPLTVIPSPVRPQLSEAVLEAEQEFIIGKIAYESELNYPKAIQHLQRARALEGNNPSYSFVLGILFIKNGQFAEALEPLTSLTTLNYPHHRHLGHYYLGRVHAHLGEAAKAVFELEKVIAATDPKIEHKLVQSAKNSLTKLSKGRKLKLNSATMTIYIQEADMVTYE